MLPLLLLLIASAEALPQGAPTSACTTLLPNHGGGIAPQTGISPYSVLARRQGRTVLVSISSTLGVQFQGFALQGRTVDKEIIGEFELSNAPDAHTLNCKNEGDTLTHNSPTAKDTLEVVWKPPKDFRGRVTFIATVAQEYSTFWTNIESNSVEIDDENIDDPNPIIPSRTPQSSTPPYFTPEVARESSTEFDPFYEGCSVNKLCFGAPANCVQSKKCKVVAAITVMGDKYDFEMKSSENPAWVGIGLSDDAKMGEDSVIECVKRGNGIATYMSYTSGSPNYGAARLSNPQLGIQLLNGSSVDGTIYCKVRRDVISNVNGRVFDLAKEKYYLLLAAGSNLKGANSVGFHDIIFLPSADKQALSDVSALAAASRLLVRLHGSFMLAAWIGTASIGILLARYYRQTWVNSSLCGKDLWFAWHRMFMILTWALTMTAFVLIFVELKAWSGENNPHAILGTVTTIICFLQPIGAYFRPHPGTSKRPLFNWVHWFGGNSALIIAIVTIFFAVKLTKAELPEFFDWILVAFVILYVITHLVLSIMNCVADKSSDRRVTSFPMKDIGGGGRNSAYLDRNADAAYSGFRKWILAIYIILVLALLVVLIIITAFAPIDETWNTWKSSIMSR